MALTITGLVTDIQGNPATNSTVVIATANPAAFFLQGAEWAQLTPIYRWIPTDATGHFSWLVPWTAQDPTTTQTTLTEPNGVQWAGVLPLGVSGTVTLKQLKDTYAWGIASPPMTPVVAIQGPPGPSGANPPYGPIASRPLAGTAGDKALWIASDQAEAISQVQSGVWVTIGGAAGSGPDLTALCRTFMAR